MGDKEEKKHRQEELLRLQAAQEELRQHVAAIEKNERRLTALYAISGLLSQSLEIRHDLALVADKVMEVMDVDAILVFLLDNKGQELLLEVYKGVSDEFVAGDTLEIHVALEDLQVRGADTCFEILKLVDKKIAKKIFKPGQESQMELFK